MTECFEIYRLRWNEVPVSPATNAPVKPQRDSMGICSEAEQKFDRILEPFDLDSFTLLSRMENSIARGEYSTPWSLIAFEKEFKVPLHFRSINPCRKSLRFSFYSVSSTGYEPGTAPRVSMVMVFAKTILKEAAKKSPLLSPAWDSLKDKDERRHWLCLSDSPPEEWVAETEALDAALFQKHGFS